ncbi:hypothetical protein O1611_g7312 [Lasiodiplodia mahajangana]|uniref:Uncharacterized protein n=1 Tax=Lasiodiplodia mahajangana TaxID=1108764 RepID=A0ACC2JFU9_9PEZI|nr:hypothetical protein O1611_g7312 [Lasiodiplodia mahajangana]
MGLEHVVYKRRGNYHGWNSRRTVCRYDKNTVRSFAGIYIPPESKSVTFRDVRDELRLCFDSPRKQRSNNSDDPWAEIAFALVDRNALSDEVRELTFVDGDDLDRPVQSLERTDYHAIYDMNVIIYHLVSHTTRNLGSGASLSTHIKNGCVQELRDPRPRRDPRYSELDKWFSHANVAMLPTRQTAKDASPTKGTRSGFSTPSQDSLDTNDAESTVRPPTIDLNKFREKQQSFRADCLNQATCCAVTGGGALWCQGLAIGPGVEACHIIPPIHFHPYPIDYDDDSNTPIEEDLRRLEAAWDQTWSRDNAIPLRADLRELFNAGLSIHPETFRVRVFVPYSLLIGLDGKIAQLHSEIDTRALRHHYEMCCIENMAAKKISAILVSGLGEAEVAP